LICEGSRHCYAGPRRPEWRTRGKGAYG
jgi:hypothetical protein